MFRFSVEGDEGIKDVKSSEETLMNVAELQIEKKEGAPMINL